MENRCGAPELWGGALGVGKRRQQLVEVNWSPCGAVGFAWKPWGLQGGTWVAMVEGLSLGGLCSNHGLWARGGTECG